jgi:glycosyltransferase involved in cell wall biosynthesis
MKVLFDHPNPFLLAHGGFQIQIEQTKAALERIGVEVEYLRWWDASQTGDIIHFFGRPGVGYIDYAHGKGLKVVVSDLLTGLGSRNAPQRLLQKAAIRSVQLLVPKAFTSRQGWETFQTADALIALTPWEGRLLVEMFNAPARAVHVVPNGVEDVFFEARQEKRGPWLVCTATVTERKRVLETAAAAAHGNVPLWVIGKPYSPSSDYFVRFSALRDRYPNIIRYEGPIQDRRELATVYRQARGFVLLSTMESLSLSALEAAACGCPLLLSDLPWARSVFADQVQYCQATAAKAEVAASLRRFYDTANSLTPPTRPKPWTEIARQLSHIYERLLGR